MKKKWILLMLWAFSSPWNWRLFLRDFKMFSLIKRNPFFGSINPKFSEFLFWILLLTVMLFSKETHFYLQTYCRRALWKFSEPRLHIISNFSHSNSSSSLRPCNRHSLSSFAGSETVQILKFRSANLLSLSSPRIKTQFIMYVPGA